MMSLAHKKLGVRVTVKDSWWNAIILSGWALLLFMAIISDRVPPSVWLDVRSIEVQDATVGASPKMRVDRIIKSDFVATWLVEVEKDIGPGFAVYCSARGESAYRTDAALPTPLTLDWWTYPSKCNLPAGRYRVETVWLINVPFVPEKTVRVMSNVFTVLAE